MTKFKNWYFFLPVLSAILFSSKALFVKLIYLHNTNTTPIPAIKILTLRYLFAAPFFLISLIILIKKNKSTFAMPKKDLGQFMLLGFIGYFVSSLLDFKGLEYTSTNVERLLLFIYPTIVVLFNYWFFKKPIIKQYIYSLLLTYFGIMLTLYSETPLVQKENWILYGIIPIFFSSVAYAVYLVLSSKMIAKYGGIMHTNLIMLTATIITTLYYCITQKETLFDIDGITLTYLIAMAIVATVIPVYAVSISINKIGSSQLAMISTIGPVSMIIQSYFVLDETISFIQLIGTILVIIGILLIKPQAKTKDV